MVLSKNSVAKSIKVHTLVAKAFIPNPENKPVVHHKDSNRSNNRVENLEWVTYQENTAYASQKGSYDKETGCASPFAKLTEEDVLYIRKHYIPRHRKFGANALSRQLNVSQSSILNVIHNVTYKDVE